jgi:truncated hemoglobin YjbI
MSERVDGNALAGDLRTCVQAELTTATGRCRESATVPTLGEPVVYLSAPSPIARCHNAHCHLRGPSLPRAATDPLVRLRGHRPDIAAIFGGRVSEEHRAHVTDWRVEVMGGPAAYTERHGGYEHMLARHHDLGITVEQRLAVVTLLSRAADDVGLPGDPEFRAAIMGYPE